MKTVTKVVSLALMLTLVVLIASPPAEAGLKLPGLGKLKPQVKLETSVTPLSATDLRARLSLRVTVAGKSVGPIELFERGLHKVNRPKAESSRKILGIRFSGTVEWINNSVIFKVSAKGPGGIRLGSWTRVHNISPK